MWIPKKKWKVLEKKVADLENIIQGQQKQIELVKAALIGAGVSQNYFSDSKAKQTTPVREQFVSIILPADIAKSNPGDLVKKYRDEWKALLKRTFVKIYERKKVR